MRINRPLFFELLQIALGNRGAMLSKTPTAEEWSAFYDVAQEQAVTGLLFDGMERLPYGQLPPKKPNLVQWIGAVHMILGRNLEMNAFVEKIFGKLHMAGIEALLVKGQGIAQCYEMPNRRQCGDVDLLLDNKNYTKAKYLLSSIAESVHDENPDNMHLGMTIDGWTVELHGTLRSGLWKRLDRTIDCIQERLFKEKQYRSWNNGDVMIPLPSPNDDVVFVFSHILQHFYKEGIGLRQICDWCRLQVTFKDVLNLDILERRLRKMGVMSEWRTFGALAVDWLGMPSDVIPFYSSDKRWKNKAARVIDFVLETGSFGRNRDYSYYKRYPKIVFKAISLWRHTCDFLRYITIFPLDSLKVWLVMIRRGIRTIARGK